MQGTLQQVGGGPDERAQNKGRACTEWQLSSSSLKHPLPSCSQNRQPCPKTTHTWNASVLREQAWRVVDTDL